MKNKKMSSHHGVKEQISGDYPNETMKILIERASCRVFSNKKIEPDVLQLIFEAGIHAATGGNLQPYSIIKIEDNRTKQKLAKMCWQKFIGEAPVNLIFCIDWYRLERWAKLEVAPFTATSSFRHFWISFQDTIICAQNICTAADALGLGSVYIGTIMEFFEELREMLKLPKGVLPVVLLCLGYPKSRPIPRKKLGVDVIVHDKVYHKMKTQGLRAVFEKKYPNVKVEATKKRLDTILDVCQKVHGEKFARKCIESIKNTGYINMAQRYFGLHYRAADMPEGNDEFLKIMQEFGFNWFEKYQPGLGKDK